MGEKTQQGLQVNLWLEIDIGEGSMQNELKRKMEGLVGRDSSKNGIFGLVWPQNTAKLLKRGERIEKIKHMSISKWGGVGMARYG